MVGNRRGAVHELSILQAANFNKAQTLADWINKYDAAVTAEQEKK